MRLLTAWFARDPSDFAFTVPGELVELSEVCSVDEYGDGGCGCGVAFNGLTSGKATTCATVVEVDVDHDVLIELVRDAYARRGWELDDQDVAGIAAEMRELGERYPVGTLVRRDRDTIEAR